MGTVIANVMFGLPAISAATTVRSSPGIWLGEVVATFGLVLVAFCVARSRPALVPFAVAAYIVGAYFFTSSTSFANPAVTIARTLSDSFSGIAPSSTVPFVLGQLLGGALGVAALGVLMPTATGNLGRRAEPGAARPPYAKRAGVCVGRDDPPAVSSAHSSRGR